MVRATRLWCIKSPEGREVEPSRRYATTGNCVNPAVNGCLSTKQGRIRQLTEKDGLRLSSAVPRIQLVSIPQCPCGYYAMGNLYFFTFEIIVNNKECHFLPYSLF